MLLAPVVLAAAFAVASFDALGLRRNVKPLPEHPQKRWGEIVGTMSDDAVASIQRKRAMIDVLKAGNDPLKDWKIKLFEKYIREDEESLKEMQRTKYR